MSLSTDNIKGLFARLDLTELRKKQQITEAYRKVVAEIFTDIVKHTPQFTGDLAQQWQIVFGPYSEDNHELYTRSQHEFLLKKAKSGDFTPYKRGKNPGVMDALSRELPKLEALKHNSVVRIVNNATYAEEVDAGEAPNGTEIRPENLYYGKVFMTSYAKIKYGKLKNLIKVVS